MTIKIYGYIRQTLAKGTEGLQADKAAIHAFYNAQWSKRFAWGGLFTDPLEEGAKEFRCRQAGCRVARLLEPGDVLLIANPSSCFTSLQDMAATIEAWDRQGIRLAITNSPLETLPAAKLLELIALFAGVESANRGEQSRMQIAQRVAAGQPVGRAPVGFRLAGPKRKRRIVPDKKARALGAILLGWHEAQGLTYEQVYYRCLRERIRRPGGREWSYGSIQRLIEAEKKLQEKERQQAAVEPTPPVETSAEPTTSDIVINEVTDE